MRDTLKIIKIILFRGILILLSPIIISFVLGIVGINQLADIKNNRARDKKEASLLSQIPNNLPILDQKKSKLVVKELKKSIDISMLSNGSAATYVVALMKTGIKNIIS